MPIAGLVKLRKHQFGRQSAFGTPSAAKRAYGFSGVPSDNLNWTDPVVDEGSLDPVAPPYRTISDLTASLTSPALCYNDLPLLLSGFFGAGVTPTGMSTAQTWVYEPDSLAAEDMDPFTYEFGDDVAEDWDQLSDGIVESVEITFAPGLGILTASASWRFGHYANTGASDDTVTGTVPTPDLFIEQNPAWLYGKDASIAIASDPADFSTSQINDALYSMTLRLSGDVDLKRFANGTQSFDWSAAARASRVIELVLVLAKTSDIVGTGSESDAWMSESAVDRFVQVSFESLVEAETAVPNSWVFAMPLRYYTREQTDEGGNATVTLTGHAFNDPATSDTAFGGAFTSTVINTLVTGDL